MLAEKTLICWFLSHALTRKDEHSQAESPRHKQGDDIGGACLYENGAAVESNDVDCNLVSLKDSMDDSMGLTYFRTSVVRS